MSFPARTTSLVLMLALGACQAKAPPSGASFALGASAPASLEVHFGGARTVQYLRVSDWDSAQGILTNTDPSIPPLTVNAKASVGADGLARTATLEFPNVQPASGYALSVNLLKNDAAGQPQVVASSTQSGITLKAGANSLTLTSPSGGVTPSIPPVTALGPYVTTLPGAGMAAVLANVQDIVYAGNDRYYFLDNGRLGMIYKDAQGNDSTITLAGRDSRSAQGWIDGPGASALFKNARHLALDSSGAVYITDTGNNCVRKVVVDAKGNATVTTIAGNGLAGKADGPGSSAQFNAPLDLAFDGAGNLYVADSGNNTIRKLTFDASGNATVSTLAGNGISGNVDGAGTNAEFKSPQALTTDASGKVYVGDMNYLLREVYTDASGTAMVKTVAGGGGGYLQDGVGAGASFGVFSAMHFAPDGTLFAEAPNLRTINFDASGTATVSTFGKGDQVTSDNSYPSLQFYANGFTFGPQGTPLLVYKDHIEKISSTSANDIEITKFAGSYGNQYYFPSDGPAIAPQIVPLCLALDASGNLYFTTQNPNQVRMVPAGSQPDAPSIVLAGGGPLDPPGSRVPLSSGLEGIAVAPGGKTIYLAEAAGPSSISALTFDSQGNALLTTIAGQPGLSGSVDGIGTSARFNDPDELALSSAGSLYVADGNTIRMITFDAQGLATVSTIINGTTGANIYGSASASNIYPQGLVVDSRGNIIFADSGDRCIKKVTVNAGHAPIVTTIAGDGGTAESDDGPGPSARFTAPFGLAIDAKGILYVTDSREVRTIVTDSMGHTFVNTLLNATTGFADGPSKEARVGFTGSGFYGVTVDSNGNLYLADQGSGAIRKVSL